MKIVKIATLIVPAIVIALGSIQSEPSIKTFETQKESNAAKSIIEKHYKTLHKAIRDEDDEAAIDIIHEGFTFTNAIALPVVIDEDASGDFDSYLDEIGSGETVGGYGKSSHAESSKIESKITEFIGGRRYSMARFVETLKDSFPDEEGEFGEKGKTINLETTSIYSDQWFYDEIGDKGKDWQLLNRELSSIEIKINGKPLDLNKGDGKLLKPVKRS
ncbi:MAG: hypothetical protein ACKVQS_02155 [Fimbriimonadaceae bacterium]